MEPPLSSLADRLAAAEGGSWEVHRLAQRRQAAGRDVIVLSIGEPDFATPAAVVERAVTSLRAGRTRYTPARGEPELLALIAAYAAAQAGRQVEPDRVVVFPGAQAALFGAMLCTAGPGEEVVLLEPAYATYHGVLAAAGATPVFVPLRAEDGFHPRFSELAAAVTPRTRTVLLNSPHNPTGAVLSPAELDAVADLCRERDLWLVCDEVYAEYAYARPHRSVLALEGAESFAVSLGSLSKSYAMTGFRSGWAVAPVELARRLVLLLEAMLFGSPPFVQDAAVEALAAARDATAAMRDAYERRAGLLASLLADAPGLLVRRPEGGMFTMVDVRGSSLGADDFALRLLEEEDVAVTPTDGFGPSAAGHVRISLGVADERLAQAAGRIARFAKRLAAAGTAARGQILR